MERQVLATDQTASDTFAGPGDDGYLFLAGYTSGTWQLEQLVPNSDPPQWVAVGDDATLESDGVLTFISDRDARYRLSGGAAGPQAWLYGTDVGPRR